VLGLDRGRLKRVVVIVVVHACSERADGLRMRAMRKRFTQLKMRGSLLAAAKLLLVTGVPLLVSSYAITEPNYDKGVLVLSG
jgi:hypothetical protein